ncbi:MAG: hypothetical protein JNG88_09840 [Phycisphaerales bacterium]|nr:hypothetical protein [Phycisphaerales bacterium]
MARSAWLMSGLLTFVLLLTTGCLQYRYSGELTVTPVRPLREFTDLGHEMIADFGTPGLAFTEYSNRDTRQSRLFPDRKLMTEPDRTLEIRINRGHVKYLADWDENKELLAFVEVVDHFDGSSHKRVFFDDEFVAEGAYLNFNNATVYGPRLFQGYPITIRFFIVELDQKENEIALSVVDELKKTVGLLGPQVTPISNLIFDALSALIKTNVDDREFFFVQQLNPVTTMEPTPADLRMGGAILQTGNYVVVKQEFMRSDVDFSALMPFSDEVAWPFWLDPEKAIATAREGKMLPNVLYFGGQLYIQRNFAKLMRNTRDLVDLPSPNPFLDRQENVAALRDGLQRKRGELRDQVAKHVQVEESIRQTTLDAAAVEFLRSQKKTVFPKDGMDAIPADAKGGKSGAENQITELQLQNALLGIYEPYMSKSYLSFTISDGASPAVESVLAAAETAGEARSRDIKLSLSAQEITGIVQSLGGSVRSSIVQLIARDQLQGARSEAEVKEIQARLEKRFGDAFKADLQIQVDDRLTKIEQLKKLTGFKGELGKAFGDALRGQLPILKQRFPALAVFAERLLNELPATTTQPSN